MGLIAPVSFLGGGGGGDAYAVDFGTPSPKACAYVTNKTNLQQQDYSGMCVEGWVNLAAIPTYSSYVFYSKYYIGGAMSSNEYLFKLQDNWIDTFHWQTLELDFVTTDGMFVQTERTHSVGWSPSVDTWYHLAFNHYKSGSTWITWFTVDGVQQGTSQFSGTTDNANTGSYAVYFAADGHAVGYFDGLMDNWRHWLGTRTLTEISDNMDVELTSGTGLQLSLLCNNDLNDASPNSWDFTGVNDPEFVTDVPF